MSNLMTLNVTAHCENCGKKQPLNQHGRCAVCGSDSVVYPQPKRDARTAFAKHLYSLMEKF